MAFADDPAEQALIERAVRLARDLQHSAVALQTPHERWIERVEAGNLYINRTTTGAVVLRQPIGGFRRSAVGPGLKAAGTELRVVSHALCCEGDA